MQRKLLKDLLTKIAFYDFPHTDLIKAPSAAMNLDNEVDSFGDHTLQQQQERNNYNMKLNPEKNNPSSQIR